MAYRYKYYKPAAQRRKTKAQKRLKKAFVGWMVFALSVAAVAITLSQFLGGPLPTWKQIYAAGAQLAPRHVSEVAGDTATKIHFIDVGQSDATLIEQDGKFCLIDAASRGNQQALLDYLRSVGVKTIQLLVMTHEHADHTGAMVAVLENFDVQQVLLPDFSNANAPNSYTILRTLELIDIEGIPEATARVGDSYAIGNGTLTVLGSGIPTQEKNNTSIISLFAVDDFRYLNCGDAQEEATSLLRQNGTNVRADLYKAAHHGASDSNTAAWLAAIRPQRVVVSCGKDNQFGHPHKSALNAFARVGARVSRTDEEGSIVVSVDEAGNMGVTTQGDGEAAFDDWLPQAA